MNPPFQITPKILRAVAEISEKLGELKAAHLSKQSPELRKKNRIRTVQASLAIEGNTLNIDQVSAIFENKRVIGPQKDILEVKNALEVYSKIGQFKAERLADFLAAHKILMHGLLDGPGGKFRTAAVGIMKGESLAHLPPPASLVDGQMRDLFKWLAASDDHILIKSCVFHYETEFIHPFLDGNGRIGRLWQTVILMKKYPVFEFLPIESAIKNHQQAYYDALSAADKTGDSTPFVEFMLEIISASLDEILDQRGQTMDVFARIEIFKTVRGNGFFSRKDYMLHFKNISTATASRDLKKAREAGILEQSGAANQAVYRFK